VKEGVSEEREKRKRSTYRKKRYESRVVREGEKTEEGGGRVGSN
jgi:hypothetical protein